jgi:large conductance mechanosensitive channel
MGMISEFKEFAMRGNVIDLAVGVVLGAAFGKIVSSLVDDLIMPVLGKLVGGVDFSTLALVLEPAHVGADGKETAAAVLLRYGHFLQTILDFVLVAFAIFLFIKLVNRLYRKREEAPAPASPPADIVLLTEIRDALRAR